MSAGLDQRCVNTLRTLAMDAVEEAGHGHPGLPMGAADFAYVLWTRFLKHNPRDPKWPDRDRFVLSAGHGSMLLYSLLHLTGYDLQLEELKELCQLGSRTPGHPEYGRTPGVETTSGPLGQGFAIGVGMAVAERFLAAVFNRVGYPIFDHYTYAIVSDGDLMEGISHEAASLAGHLRLGKLVYLYDDNDVSIEGSTDITFTEDVCQRFRAYDWHVEEIDGHNRKQVAEAIRRARATEDQPSLIICHTHLAFGSPNKQDDPRAHGAPLGDEEVHRTKAALGWPPDERFRIPEDVRGVFRRAVQEGESEQASWERLFGQYRCEWPTEADLLERLWRGEAPEGWEKALPAFSSDGDPMSTRDASGIALNALAEELPTLLGGSADLGPSTRTWMEGHQAFQWDSPTGRNFHFGVREHAMAAILNGIALHGELIPFGGTYLVFSDYMRPSMRLAAMMGLPVIYVFTHDSIWIGKDGPTHQPVEHLASLRAMPNLHVVRPSDANETAAAWKVALARRDGPTALILTRQPTPVLDRTNSATSTGVERGGYVLRDVSGGSPQVILIASGSEVATALEAQDLLADRGVEARVVSMPCWKRFESQTEVYRHAVLPNDVEARLVIEAAHPLGWHRYVGSQGAVVGVERFGASGSREDLVAAFEFAPEKIASRALEVLNQVRAG